jgi:hypothetical protein
MTKDELLAAEPLRYKGCQGSPLTKEELLAAVQRGERMECHPDSMGFKLQLEGLTDAQIKSNVWLCDCTGCRARPMTTGCVREEMNDKIRRDHAELVKLEAAKSQAQKEWANAGEATREVALEKLVLASQNYDRAFALFRDPPEIGK